MQDPIHSFQKISAITDTASILTALRDRIDAGTTGWSIDEWSPAQALGPELYIKSSATFGSPPAGTWNRAYYSLKAFRDRTADRSGLAVWKNDNYNSLKPVDRQGAIKTSGFSANFTEWNGQSVVADGDFDTTDQELPTFGSHARDAWLGAYGDSATSPLWIIHDTLGRHIAIAWYLGNVFQCLAIGRAYYDDETGKAYGHLFAAWTQSYGNRNATDADTGLPINRVTSASRNRGTDAQQPLCWVGPGIIPNLGDLGVSDVTDGTAGGAPSGYFCGGVINESGGLETIFGNLTETVSQNFASVHFTPDIRFDRVANTEQPPTFPNPRIGVNFEVGTGVRRFSKIRGISRNENGGGPIRYDSTASGGATDWEDAGYCLPWVAMPTTLLQPGDLVQFGTKQWLCFPMNRGASILDPVRATGIAWRVA